MTGLAAVGMFAAAAPAYAVTITEFPIEPGSPPGTHFPRYIHVGPDGALWYTQSGTASGIGRIATDGSSEPPIGVSDGPVDLVTLSDGTVFWTADGGWGERSPAGAGNDVQRPGEAGYAVALDASGQVVWTHLGPDGSAICRLVAPLTEGCNRITRLSRLTGLALDPNGRLWVAAPEDNHLYRLNANATAADLRVDPPAGSNPARIALGPDGTCG